jgi:hypothetical protein|tara:strand:+ start:2286 stop:2822 length:537 start_codon:yes stop_codon:yes gene_type:complete
MSGVYIYEAVSRHEGVKNIIKIGHSGTNCESRIHLGFTDNFDTTEWSCFTIRIIPCNRSVAIDLENYLLNKFKEITNKTPYSGREYFQANSIESKVFIDDIDTYVLEFFNGHQHMLNEDNICAVIRAKRLQLKLTQADLSNLSDLRQATISEMECGHIGSYQSFTKVIKALGLSVILR